MAKTLDPAIGSAKIKKPRAAAPRKQAATKTAAEEISAVKSAAKEYAEKAKDYGQQAKGKAKTAANDGKARAAEAVSNLGHMIEESATTIDEKVGEKYGNYARSAAGAVTDFADRIEKKEVDELVDDAKEMVRKSPGIAIGAAAVVGFMLARMFRSSDKGW
ncbi:MAG: hypothetical protein U5J78_00220 [Parasphingorhabdus sp.]|nr:hypothetical protein [Parasphingorhabdus sp.]